MAPGESLVEKCEGASYQARARARTPLGVDAAPTEPTSPAIAPTPVRSLPTCPNGDFCVTASASAMPDAGSAPAPYGRCAATATHPDDLPDSGFPPITSRQVSFSSERTAAAKDPKACCYTWVIPCPGGRAFRDSDGAEQIAEPAARVDWLDALLADVELDVGSLSSSERAARASQWTKDALYEHASIASFAQLTLDLLALGAPSALVEGAQRAAADEIRHAKIGFAVASAYAGEPVGPGRLAVTPGAARSLSELARATFRDACIGETLAAAELRVRARDAESPAIAGALASIAADEERHAELAWSIVAWAVATGGDAAATAIAAARDAAMDELPRRRGAALDALRGVVLPCAEAVLAVRPAC